MQKRQLNRLACLIFFFLLCVSLMPLAFATEKLPKGIMKLDGRNAPPLILKNMDDETFNLAKHRGHWVFVHFWASWCGPCRREMPLIQAISTKVDHKKLEIVVINTAESEDNVFSFISGVAPDLNPLMDTDGLVTERWQPRGLPASFFVDPKGKLQYLALGGRHWDEPAYFKFLTQLQNTKLTP